MGLIVVRPGDRIPIAFRTSLVARSGDRIPLAFGPDEDAPPEPEIVGDLTAAAAIRWGGMEARMRSVRMAAVAFAEVSPKLDVAWGGLAAQVSRIAVVWGGLQQHRQAKALPWGIGRADALAALVSPWNAIPAVLRSTDVAWRGWGVAVTRARGLPWSAPPSVAKHACIPWGGFLQRIRATDSPWSVPPKFEAPVRMPWGEGKSLDWIVRPPPSPPPVEPPPSLVKYGRTVALAFKCRKYIHHGQRVPLRFGNLACYAARPQQRAYVVLNEIEVVRLPDLLPIKVDAVVLASGRDAWCWEASLQLADPAQLSAVQPTVDGPRKLRITINGYVWVIAVESFDKGRDFLGGTQVSLRGRSATAQLAEPYAPARTAEITADRTMHQLCDAEVDGSDVELEYETVDWLVTAGAWYYDGMTPMAALLRLAAASGGVVQSDPALSKVIIRPRFPSSPWDWPETAPDVEIQDDIVTGTRLQLQSRPQYDAVIVAGERVGVAARVVREGEAGQTYAPQQVDQLITHADGARERGRNVIADRGGQASIEHDIPLFSGPRTTGRPGLVLPLELTRRITDEGTWHGVATGVRISASTVKTAEGVALDIVQTITIERHYTDAD